LLTAERRAGAQWYTLLADRVITPLRESSDLPRPPVEPASCLRASRRALVGGDLDLAEQYASQAARIAATADFRSRAQAYSVLGNVEYEREKLAQAESHYRAAADMFEASGDIRTTAQMLAAAAAALIGQGRTSEALAELRAALARKPNDLMLQTDLALVLWSLGQAQAAVAILTSVLDIDGSSAEVLLTRGTILAELGDARRALADLDRVASRASPLSHAARGLALAGLGDSVAASREVESALAKAPHNGNVLLYAAQAMELSGDAVTARELARRAVDAVDPALSPYRRELSLRLADNR
jgi:tetratricopeptide (TPR) repeat protein